MKADEPGWLYVLHIPALPGVVKVGRTARDPSLRCRELGGPDCPFELVVAWKKPVRNAGRAENQAHRMLVGKRLKRADRALGHASFAGAREFYSADVKEVVSVLDVIARSQDRPPLAVSRQAATSLRAGRRIFGRKPLPRVPRRRRGAEMVLIPVFLIAALMAVRPDVSWLPWLVAVPLEWLEYIGASF